MRRRLQATLDRPLVLAAAFLCLIPTFATLYAEMLPSGSFYDANLKREPSHVGDREKLQDALADAIRGQVSTKPWETGGPRFGVGDLRTKQSLIPASIEVADLAVSADSATFAVRGLIFVSVLTGHYRDFLPFSELVRANIGAATPKQVPAELKGFESSFPTVVPVSAGSRSQPLQGSSRTPLRRLFKSFTVPAPRSISGEGHLVIGNALYGAIQRFKDAEDGDASAASTRWLRMLYFSVVAVTTLGFGDITPVTTAARTWVTIEALLGVVLIGLFLNALALRARA